VAASDDVSSVDNVFRDTAPREETSLVCWQPRSHRCSSTCCPRPRP
jgi:hypothetical protein